MAKTTSKPAQNSGNEGSQSEPDSRILRYIQAGYSGLYLVSPEEQRVEAEIKALIERFNNPRPEANRYQLCYWSVVDGLVNTNTKEVHNAADPVELLEAIGEYNEKVIFLLKDYHLFLEET